MEAGGTTTVLSLLRDATALRAGGATAADAEADVADAPRGLTREDSDVSVAAAAGGGGGAKAAVELARSAASALRQLANSDAVKSQLAEAGALEAIVR